MDNNINILIVDDHMIIQQLLKTILKKYPKINNIFIAKDGEEALNILDKEEINILLLDLLMPKLNGFQVLDAMNVKGYNEILTIVFSTDGSKNYEALEKGAHEFLEKPVKEKDLINKIEKYISIK